MDPWVRTPGSSAELSLQIPCAAARQCQCTTQLLLRCMSENRSDGLCFKYAHFPKGGCAEEHRCSSFCLSGVGAALPWGTSSIVVWERMLISLLFSPGSTSLPHPQLSQGLVPVTSPKPVSGILSTLSCQGAVPATLTCIPRAP